MFSILHMHRPILCSYQARRWRERSAERGPLPSHMKFTRAPSPPKPRLFQDITPSPSLLYTLCPPPVLRLQPLAPFPCRGHRVVFFVNAAPSSRPPQRLFFPRQSRHICGVVDELFSRSTHGVSQSRTQHLADERGGLKPSPSPAPQTDSRYVN